MIWKLANHLKFMHSDKNEEKEIRIGDTMDADISIKCQWVGCKYVAKQKGGSLNLAKAKFLLTSHLQVDFFKVLLYFKILIQYKPI